MAPHLKSLAKKVNLNEGHAKATPVYKARVASLTSEWAKLRDRVQSMTEEAVKLKSDLKHTTVDPQFFPSTLVFILWVSHSPIVLI